MRRSALHSSKKSFMVQVMNPSPTEIVDLFMFAAMSLIQYSTIAGHLPGLVAANNNKARRKPINKVEKTPQKPAKEEVQVHAVFPPKQKRDTHVASRKLLLRRSKPNHLKARQLVNLIKAMVKMGNGEKKNQQ